MGNQRGRPIGAGSVAQQKHGAYVLDNSDEWRSLHFRCSRDGAVPAMGLHIQPRSCRGMPPPRFGDCGGGLRHAAGVPGTKQARQALDPDPHLDRVRLHVHPLDVELNYPRLLGGDRSLPGKPGGISGPERKGCLRPVSFPPPVSPVKTFFFPALVGGRNRAERGHLRPFFRTTSTGPGVPFGLSPSLLAPFLRHNRTMGILVRMLEARKFRGLRTTRRGTGSKGARSGGVNRERMIWFGIGSTAPRPPLA